MDQDLAKVMKQTKRLLTTDTKYYKHHRFIMDQMGYNLSGKDVHHKDGNHMNNKFSNLEVLPHELHSKITNIGHECNCERDDKTGKFIHKECKCKPKKTDNVNIKNIIESMQKGI